MSRLNLKNFEALLERGEDFSLTMEQYRQKAGRDFPKERHYAENHSAIAKKAKEYGFTVAVVPQYIEFKKSNGKN